MKKLFSILLFLFLLLSACLSAGRVLASTGSIDSTYKYAWADKAGWINFGATNSNVSITDTAITGYAWNELYGWINLNPTNGGVINTTAGVLSGYAWGENAGWINFTGVTIDCSGQFKGTATGDTVGTISFNCTNCTVKTNWWPTSGCTGSGNKHLACNTQKQCVSVDGSGADLCQTNSDCASHNECNSSYQCVSVKGAGTDQCQTSANCGSHKECNSSYQCVSVSGVGADKCTTNSDCQPQQHKECNSQRQCVAVNGVGSDQCQSDSDCGRAPGNYKHNQCNYNQCVSVDGTGADQCQSDSDCGGGTHNECNAQKQCIPVSGAGTDKCVSNFDCQIQQHKECNSQRQCIDVSGLGSNQCRSDSDCNGGVVAIIKHNECNSQKQCLPVDGKGTDQCQSDSDCGKKEEAIPIPPPPPPPSQVVQTVTNVINSQPVQATAKEIKKVVETPQGAVVTKTISTTGAAVATAEVAATFAFSPFEIFLVIVRLFGIFLTGIGLRKRVKSWGVVYDSVTKQPLDPAYVTLKDLQGKTVSSAITDLDGRYGFLVVSPGVYQMSVNKTNYIFPSQKLSGRANDELYNDLYFGENIEIKQEGEAIIKNIPMDPLKFDWNEFAKKDKNLMRFYSKIDPLIKKIFDWFFIVGIFVAAITYFVAPYPYNLIILIIYLVALFLRLIGIKAKTYGRIINGANGDPLSFAVLRVIMPGTNVEVAHKVADKYGKYYCLVPPDKYYIKIEKKNDDGSYSLVYTSPIIDVSKKGIIKSNFKVMFEYLNIPVPKPNRILNPKP